MTFKAYVTACRYEQINLCFISQGRVRTAVKRDGQFCCSFVANLLCLLPKLSKYNVV